MRPSAAAGMWSCSLETKFKAAAEVYQKALSLNTDDLFKPHKSQRPPSMSAETPPNCFEYQNKHKLKRILVPSNLNKWNNGGVLPLKRNESCVNMQHCGRQNSLRTQVGLFSSQTDRDEAKMLGGKIVKTEMCSKSSVCISAHLIRVAPSTAGSGPRLQTALRHLKEVTTLGFCFLTILILTHKHTTVFLLVFFSKLTMLAS